MLEKPNPAANNFGTRHGKLACNSRTAFGTFLGLPNPVEFAGDADCVRTRWAADPSAAFGAYLGKDLVGSNFATRWGSVAFFGPLTVRPDLWNQGVAKRLVGPPLDLFANSAVRHEALFTFAHSPKHIALYQKFGFWPRFLTAIMSKPVNKVRRAIEFSRYTEVSASQREECLRACREMTDAIFEGLDVEREIRAVHAQGLGDTVLLWDADRVVALGVCHCGPGSEAGSDNCYIKFGAARSGPAFDTLLVACGNLAAENQLSRLIAGANAGREKAYRQMIAHGFRSDFQGVVMQRHNDPGYNRRMLWAKLLAGEANEPGSYSVRTLRFLSTLGKMEAESFTSFCRFVVNFGNANFYIPPATVRRVPLVLDFTDPIYIENGVTYDPLMDLAARG